MSINRPGWGRVVCCVCETVFFGRKRRMCCSDECRRVRDEAKYVVKRTLSVADAAYIAGLVDGEGTLSVWREHRRANKSGFRYVPTFTISQADQQFLEDIREIVGNGRVYLADARKKNPQHKPCYNLIFKAHQTRWVLPQLLPYLRVKRRQAELVLRYLDTTGEDSRRDSAAHNTRAKLYEQCHDLNRRGVQPE